MVDDTLPIVCRLAQREAKRTDDPQSPWRRVRRDPRIGASPHAANKRR